jgi:vitamin K-dependent gamma-carboxylase-like protein
MTTSRDTPVAPATKSRLSRIVAALDRFFLAPARATPLAALRIGLSLVLLLQATLIAPAFFALYERSGVLQGAVRDSLARPGLPDLGWLIRTLGRLGIEESVILTATGVIYLLSLTALLVGWRTRIAAVVAWLAHLTLMMTGSGTNYGADNFGNIFLFYLIWIPAGAELSLDRAAGRAPRGPTSTARLSLRVVQLHLCMVYLAGGLMKASGEQWWNGDAIWRSVMLPEYRQLDFCWLADHPWVARVSGWMVILVETGYSIFIWPRRTRLLWIIAAVAMHLGIALFMGLGVFGAIMIAFTVAAFGVSAEPTPDELPHAPSMRQGA